MDDKEIIDCHQEIFIDHVQDDHQSEKSIEIHNSSLKIDKEIAIPSKTSRGHTQSSLNVVPDLEKFEKTSVAPEAPGTVRGSEISGNMSGPRSTIVSDRTME